ncbi:sensor domain-containing diguanylate cyclase [Paenibacillus caui]|uniref:sensor domain-containing diguanylate cyclase n=1 Tax=Paenibacillus caui TaxID=2873927 RepID=UPI001CA998C8|nr:sensor domain-containing diguanylate cyclase [Paenibacillus caui]
MIQEILQRKPFSATSQNIIEILRQSIDVSTIFIAINDHVKDTILKAFNQGGVWIEEGLELPFEESYCRLVCANGRMATVIADTEQDPLTASLQMTKLLGRSSFIGVPLHLEDGTTFGTICAIDRKPGTFKEREISLFLAVAELLSNVVGLEYAQFKDTVTGAFNRIFLDTMSQFFNMKSKALGILFVDIDNFKAINREFGHAYGDRLLVQCARIMERVCGENPIIIRMQGDQFVIIFHETNLNRLIKHAQALLAAIRRTSLPSGGNISASIGIALSEEWTTDVLELLQRADAKMLTVKNRSKNGFAY